MSQSNRRSLPHWLQTEIQPDRLLPGITSGAILGLTEVIFSISLGSLVFSGELAPFLQRGVGIALFTAMIVMLVTALASRVPGVIGSTQDTATVMLAVIAARLVTLPAAAGPQARLATVLVAIALTTLLTGIFFVALGSFKLGGFVRFIPYPVVGGFLAGTGWLLAQGSFSVMADYPLQWGSIQALLQPDQLLLWIPGVVFALILFFGLRRFKGALALPAILIGSVMVFYIVLLALGITTPEAARQGLILGQLSSSARWQPLLPADLLSANWTAILAQSGNISIVLILSLVGLLLNASALELAIRGDIDLNRELQAAGAANILSGLGGGLVGYHALSLSTLSHRMGGRGRLPGLVAGAVCLAMLAAGTALLAYFPKPILGGLLLFMGLDFLTEWLVAGWKKLSHTDYAVVVLILLVIAFTNFLIGVAVGLVATVILFVWNYSRIHVVYHAFSGAEFHSNAERCTYHRRALDDLGRRIYILELQGYIFFGTGVTLLEQIRARIDDPRLPKVQYILLDFRRVSGLDSSAGLSFQKSRQLAEAHGITLVLTHVPARIQRQLELEPAPATPPPAAAAGGVRVFPDLDHGLEWCEEQLLEQHQVTGLRTPIALVAQLADSGLERANTNRLKEFLERVAFNQGDYLIHQGDAADSLYFVEMGTVSVYLEAEGGERIRLQTFGLGTAVGEMNLYQGVQCTASVIADSPAITYRLTRLALAEMKQTQPELAASFHEFIARLLSERLAATTRTLEAVIR